MRSLFGFPKPENVPYTLKIQSGNGNLNSSDTKSLTVSGGGIIKVKRDLGIDPAESLFL